MKEIHLTNGYIALVDDDDFDFISQWTWRAEKYRNTYYAVRTQRLGKKFKKLKMHKVITGFGITDHIDHNGLNNQRSNLRETTMQQNTWNSRSFRGSSIYKGVSYRKDMQKWHAKISKSRKYFHLGYYSTEVEAAKAYNVAAINLFGEYAHINEILE